MRVTQTAIAGNIPATATRGSSYTGTPRVSGGVAPYKWTISSGRLPGGLKLNASTGKITGYLTAAGTFRFSLRVVDRNKIAATKAFTVKVTQTTLTGSIPATTTRKGNYTGTPKVSGGVAPYKWTVSSGRLPSGLKLNASTGKITGSPTVAGTFRFTLRVADRNKVAATKAFTVKVTQTTLTVALSTTATKGYSYSGSITASGGNSPYTWAISYGRLPSGLRLISSGTKATISGRLTVAGRYTFTVRAKDARGVIATRSVTITVKAPVSLRTKTTGQMSIRNVASDNSSAFDISLPGNTAAPYVQPVIPNTSSGSGAVSTVRLHATLNVVSDDIVEAYSGRDSDLVKVRAGKSLTFILGEWGQEVSRVAVYVDDKTAEGVTVSDKGRFTLPPTMVHDDFKVGVKAWHGGTELESEELYIISE